MKLFIDEDAEDEIRRQVEWYRTRNPAVAIRLETQIVALAERIARDPAEFALFAVRRNPGNIRRARVKGFPLEIVYQVLADEVVLSTASEVLASALLPPPGERTSIVQSLIQSLPAWPRVFTSEQELAEKLDRRIEETKSGATPTFDAADTMRRAREAVRHVQR